MEAFENMEYEEIIKINRPHGDGSLLRLWQEIRLKIIGNTLESLLDFQY